MCGATTTLSSRVNDRPTKVSRILKTGGLREHQRALADIENLVVIDLADPGMSIDPLRIFPYGAAAGAHRRSPAAAARIFGDEPTGSPAAQPCRGRDT